jgi:serine/threonine protein kinase
MSVESEREYVGHGRYALDQMLGAGGAGAVYLAYDTSLSRWVAIKRIPATDDTLFQEATVLASFQHPNIVTIYDVLQEGGEMLLVMEFVQGQTLEELAEPLTEETFRHFAAQCLEGLGAAHEKNIVHRDIKPGNIMFVALSAGGYRAKILDFGQSRLMQAPSLQTMDQSGAVIGSIYMMSPEQLNHEELDPRTDFYSLGCVFYQALTLMRPFNGASVGQVLTAHLQHRFAPLASLRPDLPRPLTVWVERLFSLDKNDRPSNALEALRGLNASFGAASGINIASHSTKGVRVASAPVLKPIPVTNPPQAPIRVAGPVAVPISTPIAVAASARPVSGVWPRPTSVSTPIAVSVTPVTEPVPKVWPVATPVSTPIAVASTPVVTPVPVVWHSPTPVSTPVAVAAISVVAPVAVVRPVVTPISAPIVVAIPPEEETENA